MICDRELSQPQSFSWKVLGYRFEIAFMRLKQHLNTSPLFSEVSELYTWNLANF